MVNHVYSYLEQLHALLEMRYYYLKCNTPRRTRWFGAEQVQPASVADAI